MKPNTDQVHVVPNMNKNLMVASLLEEEDGSHAVVYDPIVAFACRVARTEIADELFFATAPLTISTITEEDTGYVICDVETKYWWVAEEASGATFESMLKHLLESCELER